jgi:hypothetical protein
MVVKDVIDLNMIHSDWLKKLGQKERQEKYLRNYNINKDYSILFFFEIKDDIFQTSATDTDYFKKIKYNSLMVYLLFIILINMNPGQILSLKQDKYYNIVVYEKLGIKLFDNLFIRLNQKEKILITKLPLLCYVIYYLSGFLLNSRLWFYDDSEGKDAQEKFKIKYREQRVIVNTILDLINSLVEANLDENKNFLYEIIVGRLKNKIQKVFTDAQLIKRVYKQAEENIISNSARPGIVTFKTKKTNLINIDSDYIPTHYYKERCNSEKIKLDKIKQSRLTNKIDMLSLCPDGKFHNWTYKSGDLICSKCGQSYNNLVKTFETTSESETEKSSINYIQKLGMLNLLNLFRKKYCLTGELHDVKDEKCTKCKLDPSTYNPSEKELKKLQENLEAKTYEQSIEQINKMKKYLEIIKEEEDKKEKIINKFMKRYEESTNNKVYSYVSDFVDKLQKMLGQKIKVGDKMIYLKDTIYYIDHDHLGNSRKETISVLSSQDIVKIRENHPGFSKDVVFYKDKNKNVFVYYDVITLQYLGYSDDDRNIKKTKANVSLKVELGLRDSLMLLGFENKYINIFHLDNSLLNKDAKDYNVREIIELGLRNRINNLRQIITRAQSIIWNVRNRGRIVSLYNVEEKAIIVEFIQKLKDFKVRDKEANDKIFKHSSYILNSLNLVDAIPDKLNIELNEHWLDANKLNQLNNTDAKLLFFFVFHLNRLLEYNNNNVEIGLLIVRLIVFLFNQWYLHISDSQIRKMDWILVNDIYPEDKIEGTDYYQELLTKEQIDKRAIENADANLDDKEASEALDIDDYGEENDDIDYSAEALDGYDPN